MDGRRRALVLLLCAVCAADALAIKSVSKDDSDRVAPADVLVEVSSVNLGGRRWASLRGDGTLRSIGADGDTVTYKGAVEPEIVLGLVNDLLDMNFMGMPEFYDSKRQVLKPVDGGGFDHLEVVTSDAGLYRIELSIKDYAHAVKVKLPAPSAPEALRTWLPRFWSVARR
jgi:hypothetical protein